MGEREALAVLDTFVLREMVATTESHRTDFTIVWLLSFMNEHVSLELVGIGKSRVAQFTRVWPFSRVDPQVATEIGHLNKLLVTMGTIVRLFTRVKTHMCFQMMISGEPFVADFAKVGLFPCMSALMIL